MLFGEAAGVFVQERLTALVRAIADGDPAPAPDPFDPQNGVSDGAAPYPRGAASGSAVTQPGRTPRLGHATFEWAGGERGFDRPLDRAFVTVQRRKGGRWRRADDDLGLRVQWSVSDEGRYLARWEPGLGAPTGRHRFLITANRYRLRSRPFRLNRSRRLTARVKATEPGRAVVGLHYPHAVEDRDLTWRPHRATIAGWSMTSSGEIRLRTPGRKLVVTGPSGTAVSFARGALRDPHDNANRNRVRFELP
jgi:hypothetical protein